MARIIGEATALDLHVAGCATSTGFAGHAGTTANLKLTFHPDHSVGANHMIVFAPAYGRRTYIASIGLPATLCQRSGRMSFFGQLMELAQ